MFGLVFVGQSFPIDASQLLQASPTNWVLDVGKLVNPNFALLKEVCLFLGNAAALDGSAGIGLYVSVGGTDWQYRGCVTLRRPSDVFPLSWPGEPGAPGAVAQIGISVEPASDLEKKEGLRLGLKEEFAKRVGLDLFHFLESFNAGTQVGPDQLVVPSNFLDRWFSKFQTKIRRDPDFLTREANKV